MSSKIVDIHTHNPLNEHLTIPSYGVHPYHADEVELPLEDSLFEGYDVVGEIGLDYCCRSDKNRQQTLFEAQLEIAARGKKIVVIHCVRAYNETLKTLRRYDLQCVIFHGFIGSHQLMQQLTSQGYYVSYGERMFASPKTIEALRATPLDRLFLESDQSEVSIEEIYKRVSTLTHIDEEALIAHIYKNYKTILHR